MRKLKPLKTHLNEIFHNVGFRRYLDNTAWLFAERILRIVAGLFVGIWVARYLGPERFGIFSYTLAFVSLFGEVARLGLGSILVRNLVNHPEREEDYLSTAFWLQVIGALVMLGCMAITLQFSGNASRTNLYAYIIFAGVFFQPFEVVDFYFQSRVLSKYVSMCKMIQLGLSSVLKLCLIYIRADLVWFVLIVGIDQFSLAFALTLAYRQRKSGTFWGRLRLNTAKIILKDSWPMILSGFATLLLLRIDQIIIKEMLDTEAVGQYAAAAKLAEAWFFVPMIITSSLFPAIINAKKLSQKIYHRRLLKLYSLIAWVAIAIALVMTFLGDWLIITLYGTSYREASQSLVILAWAGVFVFLGNASKKWFLVENLQHLLLLRVCIGATSNVFLNFLLIPIYGIRGAATATLISYIIAYYLSYLSNRKLRALFIMTTQSFYPKHLFNDLGKAA